MHEASTTSSPHTPQDQRVLDALYTEYGVENGTIEEKLSALKKAVGDRAFFAFGGGETQLMELRASELVYLEEVNVA